MELKMMNLRDLKPYPKNAKKHPQEQIKNVAESIKEFGWQQPIVVDEQNVIIIGHCRYQAAKLLKQETVPVHVAKGLDENQVNKLRLLDNKTNESEWDLDLLLEQIPTLEFDNYEIDWGIPEEENEVEEDNFDVDSAFDEIEEPISKPGDIYQLGEHRLMCGDSTNRDDVEKLMDGNNADMVFTDPPYGMNAVSKSGVLSKKYKTDIMNDDNNTVAINSFNLCKSYFKEAKQVWWGANYYTECLPSAECWIVWDKNNGGSDQTDCELAWTNFRSVVRQFTMASENINRVHPTQKPLNLISQIFKKFDKNNEYNNIVDLFCGSGSTLIACEQLNRKCYMMEIDEHYISVIIERYINFTGNDVYRINPDGTKTNWKEIIA